VVIGNSEQKSFPHSVLEFSHTPDAKYNPLAWEILTQLRCLLKEVGSFQALKTTRNSICYLCIIHYRAIYQS